MCGIAGLWDRSAQTPELESVADAMASHLEHRGPDDAGSWSDAAAGLALAFRRLAIVDPSPLGRQPMVSADGRWVVVCNGEIYNHRDLRRRLAAGGTTFQGGSDTETLVESIAAWGIDTSLDRFDGMFAFAAWDRRRQVLHLVRDRLGEKPLLYGWIGSHFVFASELRALAGHRRFSPSSRRPPWRSISGSGTSRRRTAPTLASPSCPLGTGWRLAAVVRRSSNRTGGCPMWSSGLGGHGQLPFASPTRRPSSTPRSSGLSPAA